VEHTSEETIGEVEVEVKGGPQTPMMPSPRASVRVTSKTTSLSMYCSASAEPRLTRALAPTTVELKVWPETLRMWRMLEDIAREARMRILAERVISGGVVGWWMMDRTHRERQRERERDREIERPEVCVCV
jgi:hypothetical protein